MNGALVLCLVLALLISAGMLGILSATKGERMETEELPLTPSAYRQQCRRAENGIVAALAVVSAAVLWALFFVLLFVKWIVG